MWGLLSASPPSELFLLLPKIQAGLSRHQTFLPFP